MIKINFTRISFLKYDRKKKLVSTWDITNDLMLFMFLSFNFYPPFPPDPSNFFIFFLFFRRPHFAPWEQQQKRSSYKYISWEWDKKKITWRGVSLLQHIPVSGLSSRDPRPLFPKSSNARPQFRFVFLFLSHFFFFSYI